MEMHNLTIKEIIKTMVVKYSKCIPSQLLDSIWLLSVLSYATASTRQKEDMVPSPEALCTAPSQFHVQRVAWNQHDGSIYTMVIGMRYNGASPPRKLAVRHSPALHCTQACPQNLSNVQHPRP